MTREELKQIIIGQECVCPDGLGRIFKVEHGVCESARIYVATYFADRGCGWDYRNVSLVPIAGGPHA